MEVDTYIYIIDTKQKIRACKNKLRSNINAKKKTVDMINTIGIESLKRPTLELTSPGPHASSAMSNTNGHVRGIWSVIIWFRTPAFNPAKWRLFTVVRA